MDRIDTPSKAVDLFGAGKHGFKDGDLGLGIPPTALNAKLFNGLQEELMAVIEGAGLTPNGVALNQLNQAIQIMIASAVSQDFKNSVRVSTTANIANLAGGAPSVVDGVSVAVGNRIMVAYQANPVQNGLYTVVTVGTGANGTWVRATDADGAGELSGGALFAVEEGTLWADTLWVVSTDGAITIGTTAITFVQVGSRPPKQFPVVTVACVGNAMTITLDPTTLDFRHPTLGNGAVNTRTVSSPITLTVSNGSALGTTNGVLAKLAVVAMDNVGSVELGVVNLAGGVDLSEAGLISTTAEGGAGAADSINVVYSTVARTNLPYRILRFVEITQAAAGVWVTQPSLVHGSSNPLATWLAGYGQRTQSYIGSRAASTTYTNTTGREITVSVAATGTPSGTVLVVDGVNPTANNQMGGSASGVWGCTIKVQPGQTYSANITGSIATWTETR